MSTPKNFEVIQQLVNPAIAKRDVAEFFHGLATACERGLLCVHELEVNWNVSLGQDALQVQFQASCMDGRKQETE